VVDVPLVVLEIGSGSGSGSRVVVVLVLTAPVVEVVKLVDAMGLVVGEPLVVLESGGTFSAQLLLSLVHHCTPST
jgi:hypothetical protein